MCLIYPLLRVGYFPASGPDVFIFDGGLHHKLKKIICFLDEVVLSQAAGGVEILIDTFYVFVDRADVQFRDFQ